MTACCEEYKAALFIRISNDAKYGTIKKKPDNMHLFDQEAYPKTLEKAYNYLQNYQAEGSERQMRQPRVDHEGVAFVQQGDGERRKGPCYNCGDYGHLAHDYPKLGEDEKKQVADAGKKGGKAGQEAHVNVADNVEEANRELQECIDGVANVHVSLEDMSIASVDDDYGFVDRLALLTPSVPATPRRMDHGHNKLFLDSCATQHTMFANEYLTGGQ